jgi:hypothetical protein
MKSYINSVVISCSVLAASASFAAAPDTQPPQSTIVVGAGNDLRCRLEKGLRITKSGEPITAKLVEPVYAGTAIAIPEGSTIKGHVSSISSAPRRKAQILRGDFTRPRTARVTFDNVIFPDGTAVPIHTDTTIGVGDVKMAQYLPKSQRPGVRQKMKDAAKPIFEPNKLQRLSQAAVTSLPYHPEYFDQGTIFDATLLDAIETPSSVDQAEANSLLGDGYLHVRLLTPLNSGMSATGSPIEAVVHRPYYNSDHVLLYPAGTKLEGTVTKAVAAGWMKKNGGLFFYFHSVQMPDGTTAERRGLESLYPADDQQLNLHSVRSSLARPGLLRVCLFAKAIAVIPAPDAEYSKRPARRPPQQRQPIANRRRPLDRVAAAANSGKSLPGWLEAGCTG